LSSYKVVDSVAKFDYNYASPINVNQGLRKLNFMNIHSSEVQLIPYREKNVSFLFLKVSNINAVHIYGMLLLLWNYFIFVFQKHRNS